MLLALRKPVIYVICFTMSYAIQRRILHRSFCCIYCHYLCVSTSHFAAKWSRKMPKNGKKILEIARAVLYRIAYKVVRPIKIRSLIRKNVARPDVIW